MSSLRRTILSYFRLDQQSIRYLLHTFLIPRHIVGKVSFGHARTNPSNHEYEHVDITLSSSLSQLYFSDPLSVSATTESQQYRYPWICEYSELQHHGSAEERCHSAVLNRRCIQEVIAFVFQSRWVVDDMLLV